MHKQNYYKQPRRQPDGLSVRRRYAAPMPVKPSRRKLYGLLMLVTIAVVALMFISPRTVSRAGQSASFLLPIVGGQPKNDKEMSTAKAAVEALVAANPRLGISVSVRDIKHGTQFDAGVARPFTAASTTKVLSAIALLRRVEDGKADLNQQYAGYPLSWHLKQMINQSNNDSWALVNNFIGYGEIASYARSIGLSTYSYTDNSIAASDMALLLEKLYSNKLLKRDNTALLLDLMVKTNNEDMLPLAAPASMRVYHKYGHLEGYLHDTGVLVADKHAVAVAVYTSAPDNADYKGRTMLIRQIAQAIIGSLYTE